MGVYATTGDLVVRLDGAVVDATAARDLDGGGRIAPYPNGVEIDFPDGTKLWALSVGRWGVNAIVKPSAALQAGASGLLGPIVPGGLGVPALPDGTRLPAATDRHARHAVVYGQFADAWRVTDSTTLFDYDSGKSTAAYTQKGYPPDTADVVFDDLTPEQQSAGKAACGSISDQGLQESCVFDVAVSGDSGFAQSYVATQPLFDSGIIEATPSPQPSTSAGTPPPGQVSGAVAISPAIDFRGYAVGPDNKLYVSVRVSSDKAQLIEVDAATGSIVAQVDVPDVGEVHVAGGSVWLPGLKKDSNGHPCSVTRFDSQTLAEQATVQIKCGFFDSPETVSDGSALWFVDVSKYDGGTNKGAVLTRIDPDYERPGTECRPAVHQRQSAGLSGRPLLLQQRARSRLLPAHARRHLAHQAGSVGPKDSPGRHGPVAFHPDGKTAKYFSAPGGPQVTIPIDGSVVAGDSSSAYVERNTTGATELWAYPLDGSPGRKIGTAPTIDGEDLGYFADPQSIVAPDGFIKLWLPSTSGVRTLYYQWVPLG